MTDNESRPAKLRGRALRAGACCAALAATAVLTASCAAASPGRVIGTDTATQSSAQQVTGTLTANRAVGDAARPHALCHGRKASHIRLRRLVVTLHATIPANVPPHSARRWTVRNATKMRKVQRALCALPKQPKGIYNCPADFGISYRFRFHDARGVLPVVTADPTGCELVTGLGKATRWTATSPKFWTKLRRAIGITYTGGIPSSTP